MLVKVFNLRMDLDSMQYDDSVIVQFAREHDVLSTKTQFFYFQEEPIWSVIVTYRNKYRSSALQQVRKVRKTYRNLSRKEVETDSMESFNRHAFEALRLWRNETARQLGQPASNVFTNRQLEEIVNLNPTSINELTKIIGIGKYKSTTYGNEILALLRQNSSFQTHTDPPSSKNEIKGTVGQPSVTGGSPVGNPVGNRQSTDGHTSQEDLGHE